MNQWHAIRTAPGAQQPQRVYEVQPNEPGKDGKPRGKGYRIVPSLNPNQSAVERALDNNGFEHYMPVERRLLRDRTKTDVWKSRRFPLLVGYMFVRGVTDWPLLCETPGVAGIIGTCGVPMPVSEKDIDMLRAKEAEAEERLLYEIERRAQMAARVTRKKAKSLFPSGSAVSITKGHATGRMGYIIGADRDGKLKLFLDGLNGTGIISVSTDALQLVA